MAPGQGRGQVVAAGEWMQGGSSEDLQPPPDRSTGAMTDMQHCTSMTSPSLLVSFSKREGGSKWVGGGSWVSAARA